MRYKLKIIYKNKNSKTIKKIEYACFNDRHSVIKEVISKLAFACDIEITDSELNKNFEVLYNRKESTAAYISYMNYMFKKIEE